MVVIMSIVSIFALSFPKYAIYMVTLRDCYDSFVIYNFVALCIQLAGEKREVFHISNVVPVLLD